MFPTITFRHRLLGLVAVPTVALLGLTVVAVRPRLDDARSAKHDATVIDVVVATTRFLIQLGDERSATVRAATAGTADDLAKQRELTDATAAFFLRQVDRLDKNDAGPVRNNAVYLTQNINALRVKVDTDKAGAEDEWRTYNALTDSVLSFYREITVASHAADQVRTGSTLANLVETKERWARGGNLIDVALAERRLDAARLAEFVALERQGEQSLASFSAASDPATAKAVENRLSTDGTDADRMIQKVIDAGAVGTFPDLKPAAWADATTRRVNALSEQAAPLFERLRVTAANEESGARQTALMVGLAGLAAMFASIFLSLMIGRRLAERLRRMSAEAESIASDRLPEVLAALRSPSSEALASTLPQVNPGRLDEIGVIAESFNTVLHRAVATSIEHSQQRSRTLTDMLVNLGRRNQALIDRQLELIDKMESTQKDADVLEQLFKLDHMVTRMRRNAENLLVLASDKVVRPWSTPVTVAEILQAATSETADLSRVKLELSATDARSIPGRMAVDLSHLVAELVENALTYSPPSTSVIVRTDAPEGDLRIWVRDNGVGMSDDELDEVNARISTPPDIDQLTTDQIGFQVVGRLARRMGVTVWLQPNGNNGVAASIVVPALLLADAPSGGRAAAAETAVPSAPPRPNLGRVERPAPDRAVAERPMTIPAAVPPPIAARMPVVAPTGPSTLPLRPAPAPDSVPAVAAASRPIEPPAAPLPSRARQEEAVQEVRHAVEAIAPAPSSAVTEPVQTTTASGLARRQPGTTAAQPAAAVAAAAGTFQRLPVPGAAPRPTEAMPPPVVDPQATNGAHETAAETTDWPTPPEELPEPMSLVSALAARQQALAQPVADAVPTPGTIAVPPADVDAPVEAMPASTHTLPTRVAGAPTPNAPTPALFARLAGDPGSTGSTGHDTPVAPVALLPAPEPAPTVAAPSEPEPAGTTASGLVRRRPTVPAASGAALAAEAGQFRRLPVPGEEPPTPDEAALSRSRLLRDLRAGIRRGTDETESS